MKKFKFQYRTGKQYSSAYLSSEEFALQVQSWLTDHYEVSVEVEAIAEWLRTYYKSDADLFLQFPSASLPPYIIREKWKMELWFRKVWVSDSRFGVALNYGLEHNLIERD
ncbi:MAG: hypothetical protein ACTSWQ_00895 [Candidatus Thorarchaeota archaeon]